MARRRRTRSESSESEDEDFLWVFGGRDVATLRGAAAVHPVWGVAEKAIVLSHAVTHAYTARSLPPVPTFLHLAHLLALPTHGGRRVTERCLRLLLGLVKHLASDRFTRQLILHHGPPASRCSIAQCLVDYVAAATTTAPRFVTALDLEPITTGALYTTVVATNGPRRDIAPSGVVESALIRDCMSALIRQGSITNHRGAPSIVPDPTVSLVAATSHYRPVPTTTWASTIALYGPPQSDVRPQQQQPPPQLPPQQQLQTQLQTPAPAQTEAQEQQRQHYVALVRHIRDLGAKVQAGTADSAEVSQLYALWAWNGRQIEQLAGRDYTRWQSVPF